LQKRNYLLELVLAAEKKEGGENWCATKTKMNPPFHKKSQP
jgi:hypothetical protein